MDSSKGSSKEGGEFSDSAEFHESKSDDPKLQALQEYHLLPASVKRRVRALKKLQHETLKIDSEFYKELFELEAKYDVKHQLVFKKRRDVVSGSIEPNDEECDWPTDDDDSCLDNLSERLKSTANVTKEANNEDPQSEIKGIPDFWLKTLQNISLFDEIVQEHDRDILKHLVDIKCVLHTGDSPVQKRKSGGAKRTVTKSVREDSFFNFFSPPAQALSDELNEKENSNSALSFHKMLAEVVAIHVNTVLAKCIQIQEYVVVFVAVDYLTETSSGLSYSLKIEVLHPCRGRHNRAPNRPKHNQTTNERQECPQQ
ncbi:Nucleosome assembly protein 1-like 4 [Schistosoma japonicum]|nr:Nucleosome assembly protein 1-like 4 [Schistosoma japonicum]